MASPIISKHVGQWDENKILQWVRRTDDFITRESVEIMKLSMRCELTQKERDTAHECSSLYYALTNHYKKEDSLARFYYALKILGHRRYGCRAARELEGTPREFDVAAKVQDQNKSDFMLHQCLAIVCRLIPSEHYRGFITHIAKELRVNPDLFNTPCDILIKALEENYVMSTNQLNLIEDALIKAGLSESKIREYVESCQDLVSSECTRHPISDTNSKTSDTSTEPRSSPSIRGSTSPSTHIPSSTDNSVAVQEVEEEDIQQVDEHARLFEGQQAEELEPQIINQKLNVWKKCCISLCCLTFLILVVLTAGAAVLTGFAAKQYMANQPSIQRHHENCTVVLTEVNNLFTESLSVVEDTEFVNDFYHDIDIYKVEQTCSNIMINTTKISSGSNLSLLNNTPFYALAGSSVSLNICASTNATTHPERLQVILWNHLRGPYSTDDSPYKVSFLHPGINDHFHCNDTVFELPINSYYTLTFLTPSAPLRIEFNVTYDLRVINTSVLAELSVKNETCKLSFDGNNCSFSLNLDIKQSCFVADIEDNPNTDEKEVHIVLNYSNRRSEETFISVGVALVAISVLAVVVAFVTYKVVANRQN